MEDQADTLLALLDRSGASLHALLTRLTLRPEVAEDLMQELFMKLLRSKGFAAADNKGAYAYRAAMHLAFDWRRKRARNPATAPITADPPASEPSPLTKAIQREQFDQILDAASQLTQLRREAFVRRHIQQQSYEVVADHLGKTPHQVRGLCHRAVEEIRTRLNRESADTNRKERSHVRD